MKYLVKPGEVVCKSVPQGWISCVKETEETFGKAFHSTTDLWNWQKENLIVEENK